MLDGRGEGSQDAHDFCGLGAVGVHAGADEDAVGAKFAGGAGGHGGADLELSGFIAGGADDAALVGRGADDDGFATVFGMITLFDGREEGVHIDMEDDAIGGQVRVG